MILSRIPSPAVSTASERPAPEGCKMEQSADCFGDQACVPSSRKQLGRKPSIGTAADPILSRGGGHHPAAPFKVFSPIPALHAASHQAHGSRFCPRAPVGPSGQRDDPRVDCSANRSHKSVRIATACALVLAARSRSSGTGLVE